MPDQSQITNAIASGVQSQDASSNPANTPQQSTATPQQPSIWQHIAFGLANMGTQGALLQDKLRAKYEDERMAKEMQFKLSAAKNQAELQTWDALVKQGGSKVFNSPEAQKFFHKDPELYDAYKQMGSLVDNQRTLTAAALAAAGLSPAMANLDPTQQKMVQQNQAFGQKMQFEQVKEGGELAKEQIGLAKANVELQKANVELAKAAKDTTDKAAEKQQEALGKWVDGLGKQRDALVQKYSGTKADGTPNFTDKQRAAAAAAFNASIDAQAKRLHKAGMTDFDPEAYKVEADPTQPGSIWNWTKTEPGTLTAKVPDTATTAPAVATPETPTGPSAATVALKSKSGRTIKKGPDGKWYYADASSN